MREDGDDLVRTEPLGDGAGLPVQADDAWSAGWNAWAQSHIDELRDEMIEEVTAALTTIRRQWRDEFEAQAKRISELEIKLAEATGALDCLRGKGAPNALRMRGTFDADALYLANDVVALGGSSFVALKDRPGRCPGDNWQLMASAGSRGGRGPRGERGVPGPGIVGLSFDSQSLSVTTRLSNGELGPAIPLSLFGEVTLDRAAYAVCFRALDGSEFRVSVRGLFEQFYDETRGS